MGDIKKKRKKFSRPRKLFDQVRIDSENEIIMKFGLKNKKEVWKVKTEVSKIRRRAKDLIPESEEAKQIFFDKLNRAGFNVSAIADVLALTENDLLERRLQTIVFKKNLANSPKHARQLITHKYVLVDGKVVNIPSFRVEKALEKKISLKAMKIKELKSSEAENERE